MTIEPHTEYLTQLKAYKELADFLSGEPLKYQKYLIQHETEKSTQDGIESKSYTRRKEMLEIFNHSRMILDLHLGALSQEITFSDEMSGDVWERILNDVTGFGVDAGGFARDLISHRLTDGRVGILIDSPKQVSDTQAERQANDERSYSVIYDAATIIDWARFDEGPAKGSFKLVILELDSAGDTRRFLKLTQPEPNARYLWEELESEQKDKADQIEVKVVASGQGSIDKIPFVMWGKGLTDSDIRPVQLLSKNRLNKKSALDNILFYQGFQRVFGFGIDEEEHKSVAENTISVSTNPDGRFQVIEPGDPKSLEADVTKLDRIAFRVGLKQKHMLADDSRDVQSAESKAKDADALNDYYDFLLDQEQQILEEVFRLHAEFETQDVEAVNVSIDRTYRSEDSSLQIAEQQATALQARQLGAHEVEKEVLKRQVSRMAVTPRGESNEDERRAELLEYVDNLQPGGTAINRPAAFTPLSNADITGQS